jgi:hypothetical protein
MLEHIDEADGDKYSDALVNRSGCAFNIFLEKSKCIRLTRKNILLAANIAEADIYIFSWQGAWLRLREINIVCLST